jgi:hypothetical protein
VKEIESFLLYDVNVTRELGETIGISIEARLCPKTKSSYEGGKVTGQREAFFHHKVNESIRPIHLHFRHLVEIGSDKTQTRKCLMSKHVTKTHTHTPFLEPTTT